MNNSGERFQKLTDIVDTLMAEDGCPWDIVQTHETLKPYLVEEVYETLDALDNKNPEELKDELGDLLYQIMFHAKIASKNREFDIGDVIDSIAEKMVRRHPHVFKNKNLDTPDEVIEQWEEIKKTEKSSAERESVLDGIPRHLPNLMRAQKLQKKAAKHGFDWDQITAVFDKLDEEIAEFKEAALSGDKEHMTSEMGDMLFVLVNIARFQKIDAEEALRGTNKKFIRRFHYIEQEVAKQGKILKEMSLDELERYWQEAKTKAE